MAINIQEDILKLYALGLLDKLLIDKTTKKNILWATNTYSELGTGYGREEQITSDLITGKNADTIKTRAQKAMEQQSERTRQHAEVFSPFWVCREMTNYAEKMWGETGTDWKKYVNSQQMEITCGEAPYLVSRYNVETGEAVPISERIGLLDRKLKTVNDHAQSEEEWLKWSIRAYRATYGYDYQGDNVLISRVNLLMTFEDYLWKRWRREPTIAEYKKLISVVTWNLWQMDGLTGMVPCGIAEDEYNQINLFDLLSGTTESIVKNSQSRCLIHNWANDSSVEFLALSTRGKRAMKFDFIIGNPPYQDETVGAQKTFAPPIYHLFLDAAYKVADKVELIHPARFLFNAGSTPKAWNQKMLQDEHLKVLYHESDSSKVFQNTNINGGVAITYRDADKHFGAIGTFTAFSELNSILKKVCDETVFETFMSIISNRGLYRFSELVYKKHPEETAKITDSRILGSAFNRMSALFFDEKPNDGFEYAQMFGLSNGKRTYKWMRKDYFKMVDSFEKWKVLISKADGAAGQIGNPIPARIAGRPTVVGPGVGCTETYITIGATNSQNEAESIAKYIMSKFARAMLGVLKITQDSTVEKWKYVPLQDFTATSDIDWTKSIPEIDQQLYAKYGLDETEIAFIETHVKEME